MPTLRLLDPSPTSFIVPPSQHRPHRSTSAPEFTPLQPPWFSGWTALAPFVYSEDVLDEPPPPHVPGAHTISVITALGRCLLENPQGRLYLQSQYSTDDYLGQSFTFFCLRITLSFLPVAFLLVTWSLQGALQSSLNSEERAHAFITPSS